MPRKSRGKFEQDRLEKPFFPYDGAEVFRNSSAVCDDTDPHQSLKYLMEIFKGKIDDDVISMMFSECAYNVDQALETLMSLTSEDVQPEDENNRNFAYDKSGKIENSLNAVQQHSSTDYEIETSSTNQVSGFGDDNISAFDRRNISQSEMCDTLPSVNQEPLITNSPQNESSVSQSLPNSFQYSNYFMPMFNNNQTYANGGFQCSSQNYPNYPLFKPMPPLHYSNYELYSYVSQAKNKRHQSPRPNARGSFPGKAPSSPSRYQMDTKWKNSADVRNVIEKIKSGYHVLVVLRGLPGSGKSTLGSKLKFSGAVLSTDDFFYKNGKYYFDPSKLEEAHFWNQNRAREALLNGVTPVIIDNTNTEAWEMAPYISMGKKFNYHIVILEPNTPWKFKPKELAFKNKHRITKEKIARMLDRYQHDITVESFAQVSSTPVSQHPPGNPILSVNSCNSASASNSVESEGQCVSLEAIVHQEDQPSDILQQKDFNPTQNMLTPVPKLFMMKEFPLPTNEDKTMTLNQCNDSATSFEKENSGCEEITINNLEDLKLLVQEDSEDSQSLGRSDIQASDPDVSSWEEITEHDHDFLWKTASSDNVSSCDTLLQNVNESSKISKSMEFESKSYVDLLQENLDITSEGSVLTRRSNNLSDLAAPDIISVTKSMPVGNNLPCLLNLLPEKKENMSFDSSNFEIPALKTDDHPVRDQFLSENICFGDVKLNHLPVNMTNFSEIRNNLDNQKDDQLNLNISKSETNLTSKSASEEDRSNVTIPSNSLLKKDRSTRSFDESFIFQEAKNRGDKSSETNLRRSKFFSYPLLEKQLNKADKNAANNLQGEKLYIESDIETKLDVNISPGITVKQSAKQLNKADKNTADNLHSEKLYIESDIETKPNVNISPEIAVELDLDSGVCSPWEELEENSKNEGFVTKPFDLNKPSLDENNQVTLEQITEKEKNYSSCLIKPKPPRGENKVCLIFAKNFIAKNTSDSISDEQDNIINTDQFEEWENAVESEKQNEDSFRMSDSREVQLTPKPRRNSLEPHCTAVTNRDGCNQADAKTCNQDETSSCKKVKKRSPLFKQPYLFLNKDWSFPQYIQDDMPAKISEENVASSSSSGSQTEPSDFTLLNKVEKHKNYSFDCHIIIPSRNYQREGKVTNSKNLDENLDVDFPKVAKFEKSTCTDDLVIDIEQFQKLRQLQDCFPDISEEDLNHLLGMCHDDDTWLTNILLDSEYKNNNPNFKMANAQNLNISKDSNLKLKTDLQLPTAEDQADIKILNIKPMENECKVEPIRNSIVEEDILNFEENSAEDIAGSNSASDVHSFETMQFVLDPAFALQLEELFGPVTPDGSAPASPTVKIDLEFARAIHSKWKASLLKTEPTKEGLVKNKGKEQKQSSIKKTLNESKTINILNMNTAEMSFSEIMDLEYALQIHKNEKLKKDTDFATKLKRLELYSMFPGADTIALDEIFESNNYCLKNCIVALGEDLDESSQTKNKKDVERIDKCVNEWSKTSIFNEFENNDWSNWVYKEDNMGSVNEASTSRPSATISPAAEELRKCAVEHYARRQECVQKAQNAYYRGMKDVASFYAQQGNEHGYKFKEANKAASKLISQERNASTSPLVLDLHGLYVQEAIPALEKFLKDRKLEIQRRPQAGMKISVITGQGLHSVRGAKIRPSVLEYLRKAGYFFSEVNLGMLEIYLNSDGSSQPANISKDASVKNVDSKWKKISKKKKKKK